MYSRSTLDNIFNIIPQSHNKPVKQAFYNTVALLALFICMAAFWALYKILEPFIKPLMWALLVGSVLHPLKHSLRERFNSWFHTIDDFRTPIMIGLILFPINLLNDFSEFIGNNLLKYYKLILGVCVSIPIIFILYYYTPRIVICLIWKAVVYVYYMLNFLMDHATLNFMILVIAGYFCCIIFLWKPEYSKKFHIMSIGMWFLFSSFLAQEFPLFQLPVFIFLQAIFLAGFVSEAYDIYAKIRDAGHPVTLLYAVTCALQNKTPSVLETEQFMKQNSEEEMKSDSLLDRLDEKEEEDEQQVKGQDGERSKVQEENDGQEYNKRSSEQEFEEEEALEQEYEQLENMRKKYEARRSIEKEHEEQGNVEQEYQERGNVEQEYEEKGNAEQNREKQGSVEQVYQEGRPRERRDSQFNSTFRDQAQTFSSKYGTAETSGKKERSSYKGSVKFLPPQSDSSELFLNEFGSHGSNDSALSHASLLITSKGHVRLFHPPSDPNIKEVIRKNVRKSDMRFKRTLTAEDRIHKFLKRHPAYQTDEEGSGRFGYTEQLGSDFYIYSALWGCIAMLFWKNVSLLPFLPVPIFIYFIKHGGNYLGLWKAVQYYLNTATSFVMEWCSERHDALVPVPIRGLYKVIYRLNNNLRVTIKNSIDSVSSCVVILGLIVFLVCASIFIVLQIYTEAIMLVRMCASVVNSTVVHNPELRQLLPPTWDDTINSILDNAYFYGREGISRGVKSVMTESDKSTKIEKQVLELWDRVYQSWMTNDHTHGPKVTPEAIQNSWEAFLDDVKKSPETFNISGLMDFIKQNIGTFTSLLESVWVILKGNINLISSSFATSFSLLMGGSTAVLNFLLNMIVFVTTLFYLLSASGQLYKPVEVVMNFSPSGMRFAMALEVAVNEVFAASFKMAVFYGLWTWFTHNLFSVKIVYIPTVCATILAAIPFLGTYWSCLPAILDLWLAQGLGIRAIIFTAIQVLPMSVVDTTIYKEIQGGGHPYLTGLAIAGGIFCLGVEGAIIGPLLLCGVYVAIDLSSRYFQESPSDEDLKLRLHLQEL